MLPGLPSCFSCQTHKGSARYPGEEHSESEFYYPDELQYQENSKSIALNLEWVGAGQDEGNSQEEIETFVKVPYNKLDLATVHENWKRAIV